MPKEQVRKRGKRKTKAVDEAEHHAAPVIEAKIDVRPFIPDSAPHIQPVAGPSAIHPARAALLSGQRYIPPPHSTAPPSGSADFTPFADGQGQPAGLGSEDNGQAQWNRGPRADQEFPFGIVDPDLKAYFKGVEEQIRDWEGTSSVGEEREDRQQFLTSILGELRTHELQLATDPECSVVIERLLPSMGDRGRRILGDSLAGNWETLIRHRFASHVVQSWIRLGADTLDREIQLEEDLYKEIPKAQALFAGLIESLRPTLATLLTHPHASPPVRLLFLVLSPGRQLPSLSGGDAGGTAVRSKRSGKYRKNHAVEGKTFMDDGDDVTFGEVPGPNWVAPPARQVPEELVGQGREVRAELAGRIGEGEWRIVGVDVAGSPAVQLLLELETEDGESEKTGSLLDHLTEGLVSEVLNGQTPTANHYIPSLLTTQPGTHTLETILTTSSPRIFAALWDTYFVGKIGKLAGHPTANYVVARAVGRLELESLQGVVRECRSVAGGRGLIKTGRISVLKALIGRALVINEAQPSVLELIKSVLDIPAGENAFIVPCMMALKTYPTFKALSSGEAAPEDKDDLPEDAIDRAAEDAAAAAAKHLAWQNRRSAKTTESELEPDLKGSLLLQGLLALEGINSVILESLFAQDSNTIMSYATNAVSSRFLDAVLTQSAVQGKWKRTLMNKFMGRYKFLVEDRLGSRVGDTIWDHADGFMKEKIARSLIPHATVLANSQYGKYFARKLNLFLLIRRRDEWKEEILGVKHHFAHQKNAITAKAEQYVAQQKEAAKLAQAANGAVAGEDGDVKPKRKLLEEDEIDTLFAGVEKKKKKSKKVE